MKEEWAQLSEWMKNHESSHKKDSEKIREMVQVNFANQSEINSNHQNLISKIMHRIYGNTDAGIITDMALNKQVAASEIRRIEASLNRIWWAFGLIAVTMIGNFIKNLFFEN